MTSFSVECFGADRVFVELGGPRRLGIGLSTFDGSRLASDPLECPGGDQAYDQKVVPAKCGRVLPDVAIFVCSLERNVVEQPFVGFLAPDAGAHRAVADFVDRLLTGFWR